MSPTSSDFPVVSSQELEWVHEGSPGGAIAFQRKKLGAAAGSEKLGCSLMEVAPGKRAWPRHAHLANEEALYILKGKGKVIIGEREVAVTAGDYIALRPGPEGAHQTVNDSDEVLVYLCLSTMLEPDIALYPDSGKIGIFAGAAPGGSAQKKTLKKFLRLDEELDYWEGE
jgi:uncharacterized cupin superfamily protein